ncbi:MAG: class I adenylate-forming enzyme family protein [Aestuariivita sp.]|nr:class I adenylate-forming enzyme family protein [Aestuariivita sp.]MCY4201084.1 class I adenylate-forming enzyme family protein [Aestuariivita sp.]
MTKTREDFSIWDCGPPEPCPSPFNLAQYVLSHVSRSPQKVALSIVGPAHSEDWTYQEIEAAVRCIATGLLKYGLQSGDRVLLRIGNNPYFPICFLACIAVDLVPIPTSAQLTEVETAGIIHHLKPALIIRQSDIACPAHENSCKLSTIRSLLALPPAEFVLGDPNRAGYIVYTSGTSGRPQAVLHAHRAIWARRMMIRDWYDLKPDDRLLHAGALNWTYTLGTGVLDPWSVGCTALIPAANTVPETLPTLIQTHHATQFAAVPGIYRKILNAACSLEFPQLRHGLVAGEKLPFNLSHAWERATGRKIYEAFGMSECSTFIASGPRIPTQAGSIGRPQSGRRIAIIGLNGPVPHGELGSIAVHRSDQGLMLSYVDDAQLTSACYRGEWFLTNDIGSMTVSGDIHYHGRNDDMMNAGGYRVSPVEVEAVLMDFPDIDEACVTDIEINHDRSIIAAFYVGSIEVSEADLNRFVSQRLARYKQPRRFLRLSKLPTNANGKINRKALKSLSLESLHA